MFYLRNLKKLFKQSPILILSYMLLALATPILCFNAEKISQIANQTTEMATQLPFFHALIDKNENYNRVSRKLRSLPGVNNVEVVGPEQMKEEAGKILGSLEFDVSSDLLDLGHAGLKVVFDANLHQKSIELVREYLQRLVGEDALTMGELVKVESKPENSQVKKLILKNIDWFVIGCVILIWTFFNLIFSKVFNNQLYLIQSFQRTKHIPLKMYGMISIFTLIIPAFIFVIAGKNFLPFTFVLVAFVFGAVPHIKKWQWNAR